MADQIVVTGIRGTGFHGVFEHERREGQEFSVDVCLDVSTTAAAGSDDLGDTVDYGQVAVAVHALIVGEPVDLIETLAERMAAAVVTRLAGQLVDGLPVHLHHVAQLTGDVVVDAAEVVALEGLASLSPQLVEHLAQPLEPLTVGAVETVLHQPTQCRVEVTVIEQVVGDLGQDVGGVHLEADLRPVPARVADTVRSTHAGTVAGRLRRWTTTTGEPDRLGG